MRLLGFFLQLMVMADPAADLNPHISPADAMYPEHVRLAIDGLDDLKFENREAAAKELFSLGFEAIEPLKNAMERLSPEASVRAFGIFLQFYRTQDEQTYEFSENALRQLSHSDNLNISARAERAFENISDIRRIRGAAKFQRLGGIIHVDERIPEGNYILIGRDWKGGDQGVRLIECIPRVHEAPTNLIVVRGTNVSNTALFELSLELPFLHIQQRGPARLGVRSSERGDGCVIGDVEPESAAERAGLVMGDRILEIDGQQIDDFKTLVKVVEKKEPGDIVPVIFFREGKVETVSAELLPWK